MANEKISQLPTITNAAIGATSLFPVVDSTDTTTKSFGLDQMDLRYPAATSFAVLQNTVATNQPLTAVGDTEYGGTAGAPTRLAGNITATKQFLNQTGTGTVSAAPTWGPLSAADVPTLNQNTTGTSSNVTGTVAIANGGTGQITSPAAFNALSPLTTAGDIVVGGTAGAGARLAVGTTGQVLTVASGTPAWSTPLPGTTVQTSGGAALSGAVVVAGAGSATVSQTGQTITITTPVTPITAQGDIIVGSVSATPSKLPIGTTGQVLTVASGTPAWSTPVAGTTVQASGGSALSGAVIVAGSGNTTVTQSGQTITVSSTTGTSTTVQSATGGTPVSGAVLIAGGANTSVTQSGQTITVASTATATTLQANAGGSPLSGAVVLTGGANITQSQTGQTVTTALSGSVPISNGGTGQTTATAAFNALQPMTTAGDLIYGGAAGAGTRLAGPTSTIPMVLSSTGNGTVASSPAWVPGGTALPPTIQKFLTPGTFTYTTPVGVTYIQVQLIAGGGGGGAGGASGGVAGGTGGTSSFGTSLISATGGTGGSFGTSGSGAGIGGAGGTGSLGSAIGYIVTGGNGGSGNSSGIGLSSIGGASVFGGAGIASLSTGSSTGQAAVPNTGAGGAGGGGAAGSYFGGGGGGAGGYVNGTITSPLSSYSVVTGVAGTAGTGTNNGGLGATGAVIITEFYSPVVIAGSGGAVNPTITSFKTAGTFTYTPPTGVVYVKATVVGGGGGGGQSGAQTTAAQPGGLSSFGSSLLVANGGLGGSLGSSTGAIGVVGGTATIASSATVIPLFALQGGGSGPGGGNTSASNLPGTIGGVTIFGGAGGGTQNLGGAGSPNSGAGGGANSGGSGGQSGTGGSAGGAACAYVLSPSGSYTVVVGSGGAGGTGNNGTGGAGGSGVVIIEESYANGAVGSATTITGQLKNSNMVVPTFQRFTASGSYSLPSSPRSPLYIKVRLVGGGGGGAGASTSTGATAGGTTSFGALISATGGSAGLGGFASNNNLGGAGGVPTVTAPAISGLFLTGTSGGMGTVGSGSSFTYGGDGGASPFGGYGAGGGPIGGGSAALANTGSGGGGGASNATAATNGGSGGGSGGYVEAVVPASAITSAITITIGTAGVGGTGSSGNGGAGSTGLLIVDEFYQ